MGWTSAFKHAVRKRLPVNSTRWVEGLLGAIRHDSRDMALSVLLLLKYFLNVRLNRKTLLVIERSGGVGDLICVLASIGGLRRAHPNSWLAIITPRGCAEVAMASGLGDAASEAHTMFHKFLLKKCPKNCYYRALLASEADSSGRRSQLHLADEFAQSLGTRADLNSINFKVSNRVMKRIMKRLKEINPQGFPVAVVHSGPTWRVKEWPIELWSKLAELLSANGWVVIHVGTDFDAYSNRTPPGNISRTFNWLNTLGLVELIALLQQVNVFVGVDSGPLHVATVVGVRSIGLFGPTIGKFHVHPRAQTTIITSATDCLGCQHEMMGPLHWMTGCPNNIACMREISAEQVYVAVFDIHQIQPRL
jgi:ADP-heptose:LPS heptosyltransferase